MTWSCKKQSSCSMGRTPTMRHSAGVLWVSPHPLIPHFLYNRLWENSAPWVSDFRLFIWAAITSWKLWTRSSGSLLVRWHFAYQELLWFVGPLCANCNNLDCHRTLHTAHTYTAPYLDGSHSGGGSMRRWYHMVLLGFIFAWDSLPD